MSEPISVTYEGMFTRAGGFKPGSALAIFGAGPIGLAAVALAQAAGASSIFCFETLAGRRVLAEKLGATHTRDPREVEARWQVVTIQGSGRKPTFTGRMK